MDEQQGICILILGGYPKMRKDIGGIFWDVFRSVLGRYLGRCLWGCLWGQLAGRLRGCLFCKLLSGCLSSHVARDVFGKAFGVANGTCKRPPTVQGKSQKPIRHPGKTRRNIPNKNTYCKIRNTACPVLGKMLGKDKRSPAVILPNLVA